MVTFTEWSCSPFVLFFNKRATYPGDVWTVGHNGVNAAAKVRAGVRWAPAAGISFCRIILKPEFFTNFRHSPLFGSSERRSLRVRVPGFGSSSAEKLDYEMLTGKLNSTPAFVERHRGSPAPRRHPWLLLLLWGPLVRGSTCTMVPKCFLFTDELCFLVISGFCFLCS